MIVHYLKREYCENKNWRKQQEREGLYLGYVKFCDGLMVKKENAKNLTNLFSDVTCKRCLKKIKRELKECK